MEITRSLLDKYNRGKCTPAEEHAVEAWLNNPDTEPEQFPLPEREQQIADDIWQTLKPTQPGIGKPAQRKFVRWMSAAAMLTLAVIASWLYFRPQSETGKQSQSIAAAWKTITTTNARQSRITLPDGTRLTLNHASSVKYPAQFTDSTRTIYLSGQAFLEVTQDARRPFIVHTPAAVTRVLGTAFDIQAYHKGTTIVTVTEGKVAIEEANGKGGGVIITASQQAGYANGKAVALKNVYAPSHTAWMQQKLILSDRSLPEIAEILQRWYNVDVSIANTSLHQERFTGEFTNAGIEQVLKQIAFVIKCNYSIKQDKIMIY